MFHFQDACYSWNWKQSGTRKFPKLHFNHWLFAMWSLFLFAADLEKMWISTGKLLFSEKMCSAFALLRAICFQFCPPLQEILNVFFALWCRAIWNDRCFSMWGTVEAYFEITWVIIKYFRISVLWQLLYNFWVTVLRWFLRN